MRPAASCAPLPAELQRLAEEAEQRREQALERLARKLEPTTLSPELDAALRELIDADKRALMSIGNHRSRR